MRRKWITEVRPLVSDVLLKFLCLTQSRVVRTEMYVLYYIVMPVIMIDSSLLAASTGVLAIVADLDNKATLKDLDRISI